MRIDFLCRFLSTAMAFAAMSALASERPSVDNLFDSAFLPGCEPQSGGTVAAVLVETYGLSPAEIRERCRSVAADDACETQKRAGAIRFLCEAFPPAERGDMDPFFVHENIQLVNAAVLGSFESASNVAERLRFTSALIDRAESDAAFVPAATVAVRRLGQMLRYGALSEDEHIAVLSALSETTGKLARPELFRLMDDFFERFGRTNAANRAGDSSPIRTELMPAPAEAKSTAVDEPPAEALQKTSGSVFARIAGAAALALVAALACFVVLRCHRK